MTNLKLVLRTYSALRQMSPDDIALLETLRGLNDGDRELMVETLQGRATTRKVGKKPTSKSQQSSSKSPRASGIQAQLKERRQEQREPMTTKDDDYDPAAERCDFPRNGGKVCFLLPDHNIHHMKSAQGFHPFRSASDAPPAPALSLANGGVGSTIANSGTEKDAASNVHHAGG